MASLDEVLKGVEAAAEELLATLRDLIQIPTVNTGVMPTGQERAACEYVQAKLAADGIETVILPSAPERANLAAHWPAGSVGPRLLLLSHTDVVPIGDEAGWRYPPFAAEVADERVWGRGAADMKDTLAAQLLALLVLKRMDVPLAGRLSLVTCADEEAGGAYGIRWMADNAPEHLRADWAINEGGGVPIRTDGHLAYLLPVGEKGRLEAHITLRGRAAHAATPWQGDNVNYRLARLLERLANYSPDLDFGHPFLAQIAGLLNLPEAIGPANFQAVAESLRPRNPVLAVNLLGHSQMTLVPSLITSGVKSNSVPETCTLVCDVRTLPHQDESYVRGQLDRLLDGLGQASYQLHYTAIPSASPAIGRLTDSIQHVTSQLAGRADIQWLPCLTMGFTDSRIVRPFCPEVYGFSPEHPDTDPAIQANVHGPNESTSVASLLFKAQVFAGVAWDLLCPRDAST